MSETGAKVAFVLDHGLRADPRAATAFVTSKHLQPLTLAGFQQRVEVLRMFGHPTAGVPVHFFRHSIVSHMLPRLAYIKKHAYAAFWSFLYQLDRCSAYMLVHLYFVAELQLEHNIRRLGESQIARFAM